jgi:hypothetical protein
MVSLSCVTVIMRYAFDAKDENKRVDTLFYLFQK